MKQGIIYGGTFVFAFVIVTGILIYLNSSYENLFQFNFNPKQAVQLKDSTNVKPDETAVLNDSSEVKDSVLFSSMGDIETEDSTNTEIKTNIKDSEPELVEGKKINTTIKGQVTANTQSDIQPNGNTQITKDLSKDQEYKDWVQKITSIYSAMEPKKAAKIIQTYSDNVARDILYNMSKKTAAKVVSELSPETANRIFRFE